MKRLFVILILVSVNLNLIGCQNPNKINQSTIKVTNEKSNEEDISNKLKDFSNSADDNAKYFGDYQMSDEGFSEQVRNNNIDKDYEKEWQALSKSTEFSTQASVELEDKYIKLWDAELNSIYKKLMDKLSEENKAILKKAQLGWIQYNENDNNFVWNNFIGGKDNQVGSQGLVQVRTATKNRIRERTLKLMEYYFMMGNDIQFEYKSSGK